MANFDDLEIEYDGGKKSIFPNSYRHVLFAKKRVQIGQIWPVWLHIYFTSGYRGFPPCTLSQHPVSRETGYSNVLMVEGKEVNQTAFCATSVTDVKNAFELNTLLDIGVLAVNTTQTQLFHLY